MERVMFDNVTTTIASSSTTTTTTAAVSAALTGIDPDLDRQYDDDDVVLQNIIRFWRGAWLLKQLLAGRANPGPDSFVSLSEYDAYWNQKLALYGDPYPYEDEYYDDYNYNYYPWDEYSYYPSWHSYWEEEEKEEEEEGESYVPSYYYTNSTTRNETAGFDNEDYYYYYINAEDYEPFPYMDWVEVTVEIPGVLVLSGVGIVSNIVVLLVFYRLGVKSDSCTVILTMVGVSDLVYCLMSCAAYVVDIPYAISYFSGNEEKIEERWELFEVRTLLLLPQRILIQYNCFATTYLAIERVVSVVYPFHAKRYFNPKRSFLIMTALFFFCVASHFHDLLYYKILWYETGISYDTGIIEIEKSFILVETQWVPDGVYKMMNKIQAVGIRPLLVLTVVICNVIIIVKVNRNKRRTRLMTSSTRRDTAMFSSPLQGEGEGDGGGVGLGNSNTANTRVRTKSVVSKETKMTRLMIAISIMFLVCYTPSSLLEMSTMTDYKPFGDFTSKLSNGVTSVMELTNSCFSVFIYNALSSKFNQKLGEICPTVCCNRRP